MRSCLVVFATLLNKLTNKEFHPDAIDHLISSHRNIDNSQQEKQELFSKTTNLTALPGHHPQCLSSLPPSQTASTAVKLPPTPSSSLKRNLSTPTRKPQNPIKKLPTKFSICSSTPQRTTQISTSRSNRQSAPQV